MLTFIGIFALVLIAKFLFDTYVTGNTQKDFNNYRKSNPEQAARIMLNKGLNLNTDYKFNQVDLDVSEFLISERLGCSISDVKSKYLEHLKNQDLANKEEIDEFLGNLRNRKYEEAVAFKMDPDNTPSAIYYRWTEEYINEAQTRVNKIQQIFDRNLKIEQFFLIAEENMIGSKIYEANLYTHVGIAKYLKNKTGLREILLKCHNTIEEFNEGFIAILQLEIYKTNDIDLVEELGEILELDNKAD